MAEENTATIASKSATEEKQKRERSSIAFPYMSLSDAVEIATAIHENVGLGDCSLDQLAAWLKQSTKSSGLRIQLATARLFGVVATDSTDRFKVTQLGRRIVDPNQSRRAKADAFLTVPLYRAVFDKYKGGVLPPAAAFERDIMLLGVSEKQKERARQVFERSADQAAFFEHGRDRLTEPAVKGGDAPPADGESGQNKNGHGGGSGGGDKPTLDPLLKGLVDRLPPADTKWDLDDRIKWLRTAANIFDLVFQGEGESKSSLPSRNARRARNERAT